MVLSLYLSLWKISFACLQAVLIDSCCANSCNFGVFVGEGEVRVLLLHHFGHNPYLLFVYLEDSVSDNLRHIGTRAL